MEHVLFRVYLSAGQWTRQDAGLQAFKIDGMGWTWPVLGVRVGAGIVVRVRVGEILGDF